MKHMSTKHTPGPLTAGKSARTGRGYVTSHYDQIVAKDIPFGLETVFASAPELLESLKTLKILIDAGELRFKSGYIGTEFIKLKEAIAKAEGR